MAIYLDLMSVLGITLDCKNEVVIWVETWIPMILKDTQLKNRNQL